MKFLYSLFILILVVTSGLILFFHDILSYRLREIFEIPVYIYGSQVTPTGIKLENIVIKNPPSYPSENILEIKRITLDAPLTQYLSSSPALERLIVSDVVLKWQFLTVNANSSNLDDIIKAVYEKWKKNFLGFSKISLFIREATFENLFVEIAFLDQPDKIYRLPKIPKVDILNIHTEGKGVLEVIGASILIELVKQVVLQHLSAQHLEFGASLPQSSILDQADNFASISLFY